MYQHVYMEGGGVGGRGGGQLKNFYACSHLEIV